MSSRLTWEATAKALFVTVLTLWKFAVIVESIIYKWNPDLGVLRKDE